jgi:hypothetical protein
MPEPSPWINDALGAVDRAVDQLVDEFMDRPYQHRSEHSLRAGLFVLLSATEMFVEPVALARQNPNSWSRTHHTTQALQLEWPVKTAARNAEGRLSTRGRFDLAILDPRDLRVRPSTFEQGRIAPQIAIEIGLRADDRLGHLTGDRDKMLRNQIPHPYLVDLSRDGVSNQAVEAEIDTLGEPFRIAYAHVGSGIRRIKHIGSSACGRAAS